MGVRSRLAVLLVCAAVLLQQGAGQSHKGCHHQGGHRREDATDSRIHFDGDVKETYRPVDQRRSQADPVSGSDTANGGGVPDITLDNRNFIFAPAFNTPAACPPGAVRITRTSPCRYPVRDAAPRGPVRPQRGECPSGMARVGQWCREPYG